MAPAWLKALLLVLLAAYCLQTFFFIVMMVQLHPGMAFRLAAVVLGGGLAVLVPLMNTLQVVADADASIWEIAYRILVLAYWIASPWIPFWHAGLRMPLPIVAASNAMHPLAASSLGMAVFSMMAALVRGVSNVDGKKARFFMRLARMLAAVLFLVFSLYVLVPLMFRLSPDLPPASWVQAQISYIRAVAPVLGSPILQLLLVSGTAVSACQFYDDFFFPSEEENE